MKRLKRTLSLLVFLAMLISSAYAAFPTGITADQWTRSVIQNDPYGVLFYNGFEEQANAVYGDGNTLYGIFDFGMSTWGQRNGGKDKWYNLLEDEVNADYRGNAVEMHDLYGDQVIQSGAYFGEDKIAGKKLNVSLQIRKDRTDDTVSLYNSNFIYVQLFNNDSGAYSDANVISGTSGHGTRRKYFIELMTDISLETANYGAGTMLNGTYNGIGNTSAKLIGLDDTDWHQIDGVVDVSNGAENATVTLFVDGTAVYTRTGNIISENAFDADGNFSFNGMTLNVQSQKALWSWVDNVKITNTEGSSFGVQNVKKAGNAVYLDLTNSVLAGQEMPAIALRKVGTSNLITPASVSLEGSQAIKLDLTGITLDSDAEYQIVYPEGLALTDINGRGIDAGQIVTFYNDGDGNGIKSARLIGADGSTLSVPQAKALKGETGMVLEFEEALASPSATLTIDGEAVDVTTTHDGAKLTVKWDSVAAEAYELTVKDGDEVVYTYKKVDIATIDPIIPDSSYGIVWSHDFEFDTSGYDYSTKGQQLDFGGGMITKTSGSSDTRQRLEDMGDEYHEQVFTGDHIYTANIVGTKSFDSDVSGQVFNFSTQIKLNYFDLARAINALQINLYKDGAKMAAGLGSADDSLLYLQYDTTATNNGWLKSTIGLFSRVYGGTGSGYYVPGTQIGLDDTQWHQLDVELNATDKTIKFFLDGAQVGSTNTGTLTDSTSLLNSDGSFSFDQVELNLRQDTSVADAPMYSYIDNFILTKLDNSASAFGVKNIKYGTDAVYAELSATVASGQTAPAIKLRKAGTDELITPSEITFEGSQAIKLTVGGLGANTEYQIVYPEGTILTDINGRNIDTAQLVTFYTDGEGAGVKEARLVNIDNTLAAPTATPSNNIKGIMIKTEANADIVEATLESADDTIDVLVTGTGSEWIIGWNKFLDAKEYTLTVTANGAEIYEYTFTPVVSGELSISDFALYDEDGNEVTEWSNDLRGQTLKLTATVVNPTGIDKYACVSYAAYSDKYLRSVSYNDNDGEPVEATFAGTPIDVEFIVPGDATSVKAMLWDSMETMKPLKKAITID